MTSFKEYYWLNSKKFIFFTILTTLLFGILGGMDAFLAWGVFLSFINVINLIGEYVTYKKYKKRNPDG